MVRRASAVQRGFTLIELLLVVSVIVLLMGIMLAGIEMLRRALDRSKTMTAMTTLLVGLERSAAALGGSVSGVPHPLAGTARLKPVYDPAFADNGIILGRDGERPLFNRAAGQPLDTAGMAIEIPAVDDVEAGLRTRVVLPSDRFADPRHPHLFGLERGALSVLGASSELVSETQQVHRAPGAAPIDPAALADTRRYPLRSTRLSAFLYGGSRKQYQRAATAFWDEESRKALRAALGDNLDRLAEVGAVRSADPDAALLCDDRLRARSDPGSADSEGRWGPGRIRLDDGGWHLYALRGLSIVDAWGTEILVSIDGAGRTTAMSAGRDGAFRFHPGENGELDSVDPFAGPAGDDRDASQDNLSAFGGR